MEETDARKQLEETIGYHFKDQGLLRQAMIHSSYINENKMDKLDCNERLEFLGDAVLELVTSDFLYQEYPDLPEGELTKKRASIVCESSLAVTGRDIDLGDCLLLGKGEEMTGGRDRESTISDTVEALIGAIYLDDGIDSARKFVEQHVLNDLDRKTLFRDSKTMIQEIVQGMGLGEPEYFLVGTKGPDHNKTFIVELRVGDYTFGPCRGSSKKAAEQAAAYQAVLEMKEQQDR